MAINQLQLPPLVNVPQIDFSALGGIGDAIGAYRQRGALADALPQFTGAQQQATAPQAPQAAATPGVPLNALGQGKPQAQSSGLDPNAVYGGLVQRGLSPTAAAGITGNLHGESALNPTTIGDGGTSFGLAQWRGSRLDGLKQFAAQNGKDISDPNVQLDYLVQELKGPEARAFAGLQSAQTPADAATTFMSQYERPAAWAAAQSGPGRAAFATQVAQSGGAAIPPTAQPAQYQPQGQGAPSPTATPGLSPQMVSTLQNMIRMGGPAQQMAMALIQRYVVPPTPMKVGEGEILVNPYTGQQIAQGQVKPAIVGEGGAAVNPSTGQPIYQAPIKPMAVAPGGSLVTQGGQPVFTAPNKPMSVPIGGSVVQPDTGKPIYSSGGTMDPKTIDSLAQRYIETGDNQIITDVGNGTLGSVNKAALLGRIEEMRAAQGKSGTDIVSAKGNAAAQVKARADFATGTQGNTVRSLNVAIDHLGTLRDLGQAMQNSDVRALNYIKNAFQREFGYDMPTNLDAAKHIVAGEITKVIAATGGALGDREELSKPIESINSWDQLAGVIDKVYTPLMGGQMRGLQKQFITSAKGTDAEFNSKLTDRTKQVMGVQGGQESSQSAPAQPQKVTNRTDANAAIAAARDAIAKGADAKAVNARLRQMGVPPIAGQ